MMDKELKLWIEKLERAMDDQVALLKIDPHGQNNYFTRKRVIQIWEWLRQAHLGVDARDIEKAQEAI
jgi:hypothetical protein